MQPASSAQSSTLAVVGTFNDWRTDDPAARVSEHQYEIRRWLGRGRQAFKWLWDAQWDLAWGARGVEPVVAPAHGVAIAGGHDVVLNVLSAGDYRITIDVRSRRWTVARAESTPELVGAFAPQELLNGSFGRLAAQLREHADGQPYGYAWKAWDRLQPFLEEGNFRGFFPIRDGGHVLWIFNANLHAPLYMAGNMNGWQVGPDRFTRVDGTDLHYLYREYHPESILRYKLVHDGSWFTDPYNRWVEPDGMPVPLFQTGTFNSVLDLGACGNERGDHLLWVRFPSVLRHHTRDVWILLPRGYCHQRSMNYPVLYVNDGNESLTRVHFHRRAREAIERGHAQPCIVVFVGLATQMERNFEYCDLDGRRAYADFLARELVPFIDGQFRTRAEPDARGIVGASYGGISAYYVGWQHPEVFGCVAGQGTSFFAEDWDVLNLYAESPRRQLRLYMDSAAGMPRDNYASARYAEKVLRGAGYRVKHVVRRNQRHDWSSWQERFPEVLHAFWPAR